MKKFVSLLTVLTLLIGALAILPVSANDTENTPSLDSYLLTHWDFSGDDVYADKAPAGTTKDQLSPAINSAKITCNDGVVTLNGNGDGSGTRYLFAPDSGDLFRTPMADATNDYDRTLFIKFKISDPKLTSTQRYEIVSQNGALRLRNKFEISNGKNEVQASTKVGQTDSHENTISSSSLFTADTWLEVAICYDKGYDETTGKQTLTYTMYAKDNTTGTWSQKAQLSSSSTGSSWQKYTPTKDWSSQECKNANNATSCDNATSCRTQNGCENYFCIGANPHGVALGNNCDLLVDDIRVYGKALSTAELGTINVTESQPSDPLPPAPTVEGTMISKGHSLTLAGKTNINYYFDLNEDSDYEVKNTEIVMLTDKSGKAVITKNLKDLEKTEQNGYKLSYGVSAKQMSESFTLTVKDGDTVLYTDEYSVQSYAIYVLTKASNYEAELVELVKTMLNYGAYAQISFNYSTDKLANEGYEISELPEINVSGEWGAKVNGAVNGLAYSAATLVLNDKTHVVFKFDVSGVAINDIKVEGADDYKIIAGRTLQIQSEGLVASELDKYVQVTVTVGDESVTVSYSPLAFIVNMADEGGTTKDLVKALYAYHNAAKAYVK